MILGRPAASPLAMRKGLAFPHRRSCAFGSPLRMKMRAAIFMTARGRAPSTATNARHFGQQRSLFPWTIRHIFLLYFQQHSGLVGISGLFIMNILAWGDFDPRRFCISFFFRNILGNPFILALFFLPSASPGKQNGNSPVYIDLIFQQAVQKSLILC